MPSSQHSKVEPSSLDTNSNVTLVDSISSPGSFVISTTGGPSIVQAYTAGVGSTFSAVSTARTSSTCAPAASPVSRWGEVQSPKPPPSSWHSKVEPAWLAKNVNSASMLVVIRPGPVTMVVSGGVVSGPESTVHSCSAGSSSTRPYSFVAWTSKVYWPPPPTSYVTGEVQGTRSPPFSEHSKVLFGWSEENSKVAIGLPVTSGGAESIAVSGGPTSSQVKVSGVGSAFRARSTARIRTVCAPGSTPCRLCGESHCSHGPLSIEHAKTTSSSGVALSLPANSIWISGSMVGLGGSSPTAVVSGGVVSAT